MKGRYQSLPEPESSPELEPPEPPESPPELDPPELDPPEPPESPPELEPPELPESPPELDPPEPGSSLGFVLEPGSEFPDPPLPEEGLGVGFASSMVPTLTFLGNIL